LTELGFIVGIGVLLDTLLVRTLLVPSLAMVLGDRFWWPGRPHRTPSAVDGRRSPGHGAAEDRPLEGAPR
jgi:RND superfamily putative drug exporter